MPDQDVSNKAPGVPLADFVGALRDEIKKARGQADKELPIELGPVTVEFTVLSRWSGGAKADVKFWVVNAGGSYEHTSESTQKVTMALQPLDPKGGPVRMRDRG